MAALRLFSDLFPDVVELPSAFGLRVRRPAIDEAGPAALKDAALIPRK
jgi:hypothetical protein